MVLDFDSWDCSVKPDHSGRHFCASKDFVYSVSLAHDGVQITALRYKNANAQDFEDHYMLEIFTLPTGEKEHSCYYADELGEKVCTNLVAQGWTMETL